MAIKELREEQGSLAKQIRALADKANDDSQTWQAEDEQTWTRLNESYDATVEKLKAAESGQQRLARAAEIESQSREDRGFGLENRVGNDGANSVECSDEHRLLALQAWLRHNNGQDLTDRHQEACKRAKVNPFSAHLDFNLGGVGTAPAWSRHGQPMLEKRALSVVTTTLGEYTVPPGFVYNLERAMLAYNGPRQVATILRTESGQPLEWPTVTDTGNVGALLAENTTIGASTDPTFGTKALDAYKYSSKPVLVPAELLQDSAFNLGQLIPDMLGERIGRIQAQHFTTGTGSSQPNGVVTAASAGVTAAGAAAITGDDLINLVHSVDPAYRQGATGFMFHDNVLLAARKLKDSQNQYLWQPGLQASEPDRLFGFPYTINQNMASTIATAAITALFGDFSKFIIRDVSTIRLYRLEERYRDLDQTGFVAFMRSDSECIQTAAIKKLTQA